MNPNRILISNGPGVNVDRDGLERWCREWSEELGHDLECAFADSEEAFVAQVESAAGSVRGFVLNPGAAADSDLVLAAARRSGAPIVWVDLMEAERPRPKYIDGIETMSIRGRGIWSYRWAIQHLLQRIAYPYTVIPYGEERDQVGDLRLPEGGSESLGIAILLHGGFWRERWERDTIEPLAIDLARRGWATWNLEYRRLGPFGGGWPRTGEDVARGIDHVAQLAELHPLDLENVIVVGHSAGGHLALWSVKRLGVAFRTLVRPRLVVSIAGLADLAESARRGLGDTDQSTSDFVGGEPEDIPDAYRDASPIAALPLEVPQIILQGRLDNIPDLVDLSRLYVAAARQAGDVVEFIELDDVDHFQPLDPASDAWHLTLEKLEQAAPSAS